MTNLSAIVSRGLASARPTASTLPVGSLYYSTDTGVIERTNGSTWDSYSAGFANPMTTAGDLILGGSSGTPGRLAKGADNTFLTIDPATHLPVWATWAQARYSKSSAQSIANNTTTVIDYPTSVYDSHSRVTTGASWHWTADVAMRVRVAACVLFGATNSWAFTELARLWACVNATTDYILDNQENIPNSNVSVFLKGSTTIALAASDTLDIRVSHTNGNTLPLNVAPSFNWVCIERVA